MESLCFQRRGGRRASENQTICLGGKKKKEGYADCDPLLSEYEWAQLELNARLGIQQPLCYLCTPAAVISPFLICLSPLSQPLEIMSTFSRRTWWKSSPVVIDCTLCAARGCCRHTLMTVRFVPDMLMMPLDRRRLRLKARGIIWRLGKLPGLAFESVIRRW